MRYREKLSIPGIVNIPEKRIEYVCHYKDNIIYNHIPFEWKNDPSLCKYMVISTKSVLLNDAMFSTMKKIPFWECSEVMVLLFTDETEATLWYKNEVECKKTRNNFCYDNYKMSISLYSNIKYDPILSSLQVDDKYCLENTEILHLY